MLNIFTFKIFDRISFKQSTQIILYFLVSLLIGIIVTLVLDSIDNISVEKKIRKDLKQEIEHAASSFKDSARTATADDVIHFIKEFTDSALSDKIIAVRPELDTKPDSKNCSFLFTYREENKQVDYYIITLFLNRELAILDMPQLIFGLFTSIIVFTFIVLYMEKRKQTLVLKREYETSHAQFKKVIEEQEALSLLGRMVATLAHEIKTPIATISNLIQTLPARIGDKQFTKRFIEMTKEELDRTHQLINNLLVYGKEIEISKEEWIPLIPLINELASKKMMLTEGASASAIYGDRFYLELLFENLLRNSRAASADKIQVKVRPGQVENDSEAQILFEDNGRGFPPNEDIDTLINPFVTSSSSGAGLGLHLVRKIASAHHGKISLYKLEYGAGVMISLPRNRIIINE